MKEVKRRGRPKGSKNKVPRGARKLMSDVIYGLEELEVGRQRLRLASAAFSAPKMLVALAAIRVHAKHIVKVLEPLAGSD